MPVAPQTKVLLIRDDFKVIRTLSANISDDVFNQFIIEAQETEMRSFFGDAFYSDLINDFDELGGSFDLTEYQTLFFGGGPAGFLYNGYSMALLYFTYARILTQQQVNVSRFGVESIQNEISEDTTNPQIRMKIADANKMAFHYQNQTIKFLDENKTDYPLYIPSDTNPRKVNTSFFKL